MCVGGGGSPDSRWTARCLVSGLLGAWGKKPGEKLLPAPMSHPWKDALSSLGFAQSGGGGKDQIRFVIGRKVGGERREERSEKR